MNHKLSFKHNHLPHFDDFVTATKIQRTYYNPLHKLFWYQLNGLVLKDRAIIVGNIQEDTKIHILCPMRSGKAKASYRDISKEI